MANSVTCRVCLTLSLIVFTCGWRSHAAETNPNPPFGGTIDFKVKDYAELSQMEVAAERARRLYWRGQYEEAARAFTELASRRHASTALYLNEAALANAAAGDFKRACDQLMTAASYLETVTNSVGQQKALSYYGKEVAKIYYGDPYERAMQYLLLAVFFLDKGDYDNALAACKSGILADSDAMENRYQSDFTLLHLLEAKCYLLRGQPDAAVPVFKAAREAFRVSNPQVRPIVSERLALVEGLRLSKKERRDLNLAEDPAVLNTNIRDCDTRLEKASQSIDPEKGLGLLLKGDYNALIIVPQGRAPFKSRTGSEADVVVFKSRKADLKPAAVLIDTKPLIGEPAESCTADVEFQAETRGGRYMDGILKGKARFKRNTVRVGNTFTQTGAQIGGLEGLPFIVIGGIIEATGGAMTPEADTRCWKTLPAGLEVYALNLPDGSHDIGLCRYLYFEKLNAITRSISVAGRGKLAVIYGPPSPAERYSAQVLAGGILRQTVSAQTNAPPAGSTVILVPPPLGMALVERFPSPDHKKFPRAFPPDPNQLMRTMREMLKRNGIHPVLLSHEDASKPHGVQAQLAALALQVELTGLDMRMDKDREEYTADFAFALVNVENGVKVLSESMRGTAQKAAKDKPDCTGAFYHCFDEALSTCLSSAKFKSLTQSASQ